MSFEMKKSPVMSYFSFSLSDFYPFKECFVISSNLKLLSESSFNLEETKICHLGKLKT